MFDKKQIIEIDNYICLVKKISSKKFYEKKYNKVCKNYQNIISNSSIIVEGPAPKKRFICRRRGQILVKTNEKKNNIKIKLYLIIT